MFSDPQSVTVNSVAQSMPRVQLNSTSAIYRKNDGTFQLSIQQSHSSKGGEGRQRSNYRLDQTVVATDPISSENVSKTASIYIVMDKPDFGFTMLQLEQLAAGFLASITTSAGGTIDKLAGGEF